MAPLARTAVRTEPSAGLLPPCDVVVRYRSDTQTAVDALDPPVMVSMTRNAELQPVADEAAQRPRAALDTLG